MTVNHPEYEAALTHYNGAAMLEGNRGGPAHPMWKQHSSQLDAAEAHVSRAFESAMRSSSVDMASTVANSHERQRMGAISEAHEVAGGARQALAAAARQRAPEAVETLSGVLGHQGWNAPSKAELMRRTDAYATKHEMVASKLTVRPGSFRMSASGIVDDLPEQVRPLASRLPSSILSRYADAHHDTLRRS